MEFYDYVNVIKFWFFVFDRDNILAHSLHILQMQWGETRLTS